MEVSLELLPVVHQAGRDGHPGHQTPEGVDPVGYLQDFQIRGDVHRVDHLAPVYRLVHQSLAAVDLEDDHPAGHLPEDVGHRYQV